MRVYVVLYDSGYDHEDYIGVYSSEEKAHKGIEKDIVRRFFECSPGDMNYYKSYYYILEEEVE